MCVCSMCMCINKSNINLTLCLMNQTSDELCFLQEVMLLRVDIL